MRQTNAIALGLAAGALVACYNTNGLTNGGLRCTDGKCPTGYSCQIDQGSGSTGHCWKDGTYSVSDAGNQDTTTPTSDSNPPACTVATPPFGPFVSCVDEAVPNSTCDPVCQSGCSCFHRCVIDEQTNTSFKCEATAQSVTTTFVAPMHSCAADTTRCEPGSVCIADATCGHLCYKTCRGDKDCAANSRCTSSSILDSNHVAVKNLFFCSPPIESCSPVGAATCNTGISGLKCVFLAGLTTGVSNDATVCDCSSQHTKLVGEKCTSVPDNCQPGSLCFGGTCHSVCSLAVAGGCSTGSACTAIYGSSTYGYCR